MLIRNSTRHPETLNAQSRCFDKPVVRYAFFLPSFEKVLMLVQNLCPFRQRSSCIFRCGHFLPPWFLWQYVWYILLVELHQDLCRRWQFRKREAPVLARPGWIVKPFKREFERMGLMWRSNRSRPARRQVGTWHDTDVAIVTTGRRVVCAPWRRDFARTRIAWCAERHNAFEDAPTFFGLCGHICCWKVI